MRKTFGRLPRIALVTHNLVAVGGTATLTAFLYRILAESGRYQPEVISLAMSSADSSSTRLRAPQSWRRGPSVEARDWYGLPYRHVGAHFTEFEFQRYRPRTILTDLLQESDLIQFVTGTPPWACAANGVTQPVALWTATTVWADRASRARALSLLHRGWMLLMTRIVQGYEKQALRKMDFVFALSEYTFDALRSQVAPQHVGLAPCGVDTVFFHPAAQARGEYILSVARFSDPRKNVPLLLNAYARLCRRMTSAPRLMLAGTPEPSKEHGQLMQELGIADRVEVCTNLSQDDLAEAYRHARLFVLSSDEEGLGIVILEAMACGVPVVSTRCGGPEKAVVDGETGFLTPVGKAQALADAMQRVLDDPSLCLRMGEAGRQRAEERFSLAATGKVFLDKYEELLDLREQTR